MTGSLRVTVIGAGQLGCQAALQAQAAGHQVTLIDEHPQTMGQMSFDGPWFYGAALPGALANENAIAQSVLEGSPQLMECFEAGIDVRVSTIAWGAFQTGQNNIHVGAPKVGLVDAEGNCLLEHDALILATGARDFVIAFAGADLPGVFGVKAGLAFLDLYQCYEGRETLVLGTSAIAVEFVRRALARGVHITGMIEPGTDFQAGAEAAAEIAALGIPVHHGQVIRAAEGRLAVTGARICPADGGGEDSLLPCDSICMALAALPNIELPAAMGCELCFDEGLSTWLPRTDGAGKTSLDGVFWLSGFAASEVAATVAALSEPADVAALAPVASTEGQYLSGWIAALHRTGGTTVNLCKCEEITRSDFLGLRPPGYLKSGLRLPHSPVNGCGTGPKIYQDHVKRLTRVGMGHCQGKRCRDEAALLLSQAFGVGLKDIRPGSYRFPVRPINLDLMAAPDDTPDLQDKWSYWLHPSPSAAE